jgi:hypothetical protein
MSVAGIASSTLLHYSGQVAQSYRQKWQQGLQQLGQDLQSGNLSAAQTDFASLQQLTPQTGSTSSPSSTSSTSSSQSSNSLAQELNQLGTDLQAGNTTAAQQDYQQIQQQASATASGAAHHHHHAHPASSSEGSQLSQLLQQLGQQLQAGSLSGAQQAYTALQQQLQSWTEGGATTSSTTPASVAVTA